MKYYYKFNDVDLLMQLGGFENLRNIRLYTEAEYASMTNEDRAGMWGVYKPFTWSSETEEYNSIDDAINDLIENEMTSAFERVHDL